MTTTERFLRYVAVHTTSDPDSQTRPSTECQMDLIHLLEEELTALGLQDVHIGTGGILYGTIPANTETQTATLGFLAHVDTSDDAPGQGVRPRIIEHYDGGTIQLNETVSMAPDGGFAHLRDVVGEDLIVSDGTTLLGADDKAGVAEIMTMAETLLHTDVPHGTVKVAFTTDEEVGRGPDGFDIPGFACDFAYTVDGGPLGEIEYENFNAATTVVTIHGVGVHPGAAKDTMVNACTIAMEYQQMLPEGQVPERTEGYEGFIHLQSMVGTVEQAKLGYILRDHDLNLLRAKEQIMTAAADDINLRHGAGTATVETRETYYNMREKILPHMHLVETAKAAFQAAGVEPKTVPIRGGTDGAQLSFKGLPCPNLSTGGYQFHSVHEFIPVRSLETMPQVLLNIIYHYGKGGVLHAE